MDKAVVHHTFQDDALIGLGLAYLLLNERLYVEEASRSLGKLFETTPSEIIGRSLFDLLVADDVHAIENALGQTPQSVHGEPPLQAKAVTAKRPGGGTFFAEITIAPLSKTKGYVCLFQDLSPIHEVRKALSANQERFALALAGTNEGIWDWDVASGRIFVSGRVRELFSQDCEMDMDLDWFNLVHPEDQPRYKSAMLAHLKDETPFLNIDYRLNKKEPCWVRHRGLGVRDANGRVFRMAGSVGDVTEAKLAESRMREALSQAEAASKAKSDFLAAMSHELRTPLNAIIGFSEMIHGEMLGPVGTAKYGEYAGDIMASARHLLDIINDILEMARMDAGQADYRPEPVSITSVIDASLRLLHQRVSHSGLTTTTKYQPSLPQILGDERRLKQVMINLIGNAIKFTPQGGSIVIEAKTVLDGRLMVRVVDSGIGIAERDIPRALTPFTQVDSVVARRYQGSGLGLPLAKAFVELHGGNLELSSILGKGTTVTMHFPISTQAT